MEAQRLVRKICTNCKTEEELPASVLEEIQPYIPEGAKFYIGKGCKECNDTGYMGREMICEVLTITDELSSLIAKGASKEELRAQADKDGFVPLFQNGIQKALDGITSSEEVLRVAKE